MHKTSIFFVTLFSLLAFTLAACSPQPIANDLTGTSWHLVSYGQANQQTPAADGVTTLVQFTLDGQVSGSLGCNQFSGKYSVKGDKITFDQLISTLMACPEPQMSQETAAFQVLSGTVRFELTDNSLVIFDESGQNAIHLTKLLMQ
jgi:heat shock protein HslJ